MVHYLTLTVLVDLLDNQICRSAGAASSAAPIAPHRTPPFHMKFNISQFCNFDCERDAGIDQQWVNRKFGRTALFLHDIYIHVTVEIPKQDFLSHNTGPQNYLLPKPNRNIIRLTTSWRTPQVILSVIFCSAAPPPCPRPGRWRSPWRPSRPGRARTPSPGRPPPPSLSPHGRRTWERCSFWISRQKHLSDGWWRNALVWLGLGVQLWYSDLVVVQSVGLINNCISYRLARQTRLWAWVV